MFRSLLLLLLLPSLCGAADINLEWDASPDAVTGYKIYYGDVCEPPLNGTAAIQGDSPVDVGDTLTATMSLPYGAEYCFRATAYDAAGHESTLSNCVCAFAGPAAPVNLRVSP